MSDLRPLSWRNVWVEGGPWNLGLIRPKMLMHLHGVLTIAWCAMIPIALITGWIESLIFISAISIYANVAGHFSAWQAARTEVRQEDSED